MKVTTTEIIEATPEELAAAFCNMGSDEQAAFFAECERIGLTWREKREKEGSRGWFLGSGWQWFQVGQECLKAQGGLDSPAARALATMAAPLFAHSMLYCERIQQVND